MPATTRPASPAFGTSLAHGSVTGVEDLDSDDGFLALTLTASKTFKTAKGAVAWLAARGYDAFGCKAVAS